MSARWLTADVFDGLAQLEVEGVQADLVLSSPPFLAVRSYLPADHPDKAKEIGSEATPADFIDTLLAVVAACDRVLAPHGSLVFELGDTYAGSGGAGGDYQADGLRDGQPKFSGSNVRKAYVTDHNSGRRTPGPGWPLAKSKALIPELFAIALAYGINPITGQPSPAGRWRVRNVIAWCRTNPPVGALGDKFRPAHSEIIVACRGSKRWFDDIPTRKPLADSSLAVPSQKGAKSRALRPELDHWEPSMSAAGAPLQDWWVINNTGTKLSHYATYPEALCVPIIQSMCPERVCRTCGKPSERIVTAPEYVQTRNGGAPAVLDMREGQSPGFGIRNWSANGAAKGDNGVTRVVETLGWTDCGHDNWRRGITLDPFGGTGTTLAAAISTGRDGIGIDLDPANLHHAQTRLGMFLEAVA